MQEKHTGVTKPHVASISHILRLLRDRPSRGSGDEFWETHRGDLCRISRRAHCQSGEIVDLGNNQVRNIGSVQHRLLATQLLFLNMGQLDDRDLVFCQLDAWFDGPRLTVDIYRELSSTPANSF